MFIGRDAHVPDLPGMRNDLIPSPSLAGDVRVLTRTFTPVLRHASAGEPRAVSRARSASTASL